jgi:hypothetical protein
MINFNCSLTNPWSTRWRTMFCKFGLVGQYTAWEFNGYRTHYIIDIDFRLTFKGDHPGVFITAGLLGYSLELSIYDTRHEDMR